MPASIMFAHRIMRKLEEVRKSGDCAWLRPDAKCQVTVEYGYENGYAGKPCHISAVELSTQHAPDATREEIEKLCLEVITSVLPASLVSPATQFHINPTGRFVTGGPQADCGVTGRKIIADTYGGVGRHGGGELTGTLPSFFAELKTKTLIYQCFCFAKTAKNAIFGSLLLRSGYNSDKWHFNAWLFFKVLIINSDIFP